MKRLYACISDELILPTRDYTYEIDRYKKMIDDLSTIHVTFDHDSPLKELSLDELNGNGMYNLKQQDENYVDEEGLTTLHKQCKEGNYVVIRNLVERFKYSQKKMKVNITDIDLYTSYANKKI